MEYFLFTQGKKSILFGIIRSDYKILSAFLGGGTLLGNMKSDYRILSVYLDGRTISYLPFQNLNIECFQLRVRPEGGFKNRKPKPKLDFS